MSTILKTIRKTDIFLIIVLIIAGIAASAYLTHISAASGTHAEITIDGRIFGTYELSKDRTIDLKTGNIAVIKDGQIYMKSADCHGQDCIRQGKISKPSQTIVCLPHKVMIEMKGGSDEYDTISK